jgi:hypothetical protein
MKAEVPSAVGASAGKSPAIGAAYKLAHHADSNFVAYWQHIVTSRNPRRGDHLCEGTPMPAYNSAFSWKLAIAMLGVVARGGDATAQSASPPPSVSVTPVVSRQVTETGNFVGRVTAIDKVDVVARTPGFIERRDFTEGQQVKKGDLLFRIEQDTYKAAAAQQRANLAKAKAAEVDAALQLERGKELVRDKNIPASNG